MTRSLVAVVLVLGVALGIWFATRGDQAPPPATVGGGPAEVTTEGDLDTSRGAGPESAAPEAREEVDTPRAAPTAGATGSAASSTDGATIVVRVSYAGVDDAVVGMPVYVYRGQPDPWGARLEEETDEEGVARFEGVEPGNFTILGADGGYRSLAIGTPGAFEVQLVIPAGFSIEGTVVDNADAPIAGAQIWLSDPWSQERGRVRGESDAQGRFSFSHLTGSRTVSVVARGFASSNMQFANATSNETVRLHFRLVPGNHGVVRGRVTDEDGHAIAGALVRVGPTDDTRRVRGANGDWVPGPAARTTESGDDGRFEVDLVPPGARLLRVVADDHAPYRAPLDVPSGGSIEHTAVLGSGAWIYGVVTGVDGAPLEDAKVQTDSGFGQRVTWTDAEGNYRLEYLEVGIATTVQANSGTDRARVKVLVEAATEYRVDLLLEGAQPRAGATGNVVRGVVVDTLGEPQARWRVVLTAAGGVAGKREVTRTKANGEFEQRVPWPTVAIAAFPPGKWSAFPAAFEPSVPADGVPFTVRVRGPLEATGSIRGRVIGSAGEPRPASIRVWHTQWRLYGEVENDPDTGEFRIDHVYPGVNKIDVHGADFPWIQVGDKEVGAGQLLDLGDLIAARAGGIQGAVTVRGAPIPAELRFVITRRGSEAGVIQYADGRFQSGPLAAAEDYTLIVSGEGVATEVRRDVAVRADATTRIDLEFRRAAIRELRFTVPNGVERPIHFHVIVREKVSRRQVWSGGVMPNDDLVLRASLPVGEFTVIGYGTDGKKLGEWPLRVDSLSASGPVDYSL